MLQERAGDVPVQTIDTLTLPTPSIIKIDAEKQEFRILKGALQTLRIHKPHLIFEHWFTAGDSEKSEEMLLFLADLAYEVFAMQWSSVYRGAHGSLYLIPIKEYRQMKQRCNKRNLFACHQQNMDNRGPFLVSITLRKKMP